MVLLLAETPQGYALFKAKKSSLLKASAEEIISHFEDVKSANKTLSLEHFTRFKDVKEATLEVAALQEGKIGDVLKKMIKKKIIKAGLASETLCVWDKNLMSSLKKKFGLEMMMSPTTHEIFRGLKENLDSLVAELGNDEQSRMMNMSLAHSLNRFKLKFSPEKIDIMVIQAIGLLDDLDKELNNLAMRLKEWYGFHFPELLRIVVDNSSFAKIVKQIGFKTNLKDIKTLKHIVPEEIEAQIRRSAETSMGSELLQQDLDSILELSDRVIELSEYRQSLSEYLKKRMETIAPNLTYIVGEILAARLLAQAGSLMDLAKHPASTVQILGAEKALFRALKNKTNTPKYGLIFHAHLVGQSSPKFKGKMSRILANKIALCTRLDACGDQKVPTVAIGAMAYCERKLEEFSETTMTKAFSANRTSAQIPQYVPKRLKLEQ